MRLQALRRPRAGDRSVTLFAHASGDAINAVLAAVNYNFHRLIAWLTAHPCSTCVLHANSFNKGRKKGHILQLSEAIVGNLERIYRLSAFRMRSEVHYVQMAIENSIADFVAEEICGRASQPSRSRGRNRRRHKEPSVPAFSRMRITAKDGARNPVTNLGN